jgi:hypothetical protein
MSDTDSRTDTTYTKMEHTRLRAAQPSNRAWISAGTKDFYVVQDILATLPLQNERERAVKPCLR